MRALKTFRARLGLGLAPQLIGLIILVALVAGGLVGAVLIENSRSAMRDRCLENNLATADLAATFAANYVEGAETNLRQFATRTLFLRAIFDHDVEQAELPLAEFLQIDARFDSVSIYDATGIGWASGLMDKWQNRGGTVADREWFQQALATKKPYFGIPVISRATGHAIGVYAVPILDDQGQLRAVLGGGISLAALSDAITGLRVSASARASLVDARQGGIIVAHPDQTRILTPVTEQDAAALRAIAGERGTMETRSSGGELDLAAFAPVPRLPWSVMILEPTEAVFAPVNALTQSALLLIGITMLIAAVLGVLLARTITRPVRQLVRGAEEIGKGNLDYRIQPQTRDEIGQLADAFNAMAENLQSSLGETARGHRLLFALSQAAQAVQRARTSDEIYRAVGQAITGLGYQAMVFDLSEDYKRLSLTHHTVESGVVRAGEKLTGLSARGFHFDVKPGSIHHQVVTTGQPRFFEHKEAALADSLPNVARFLIGHIAALLGAGQIIYAPLTSEGVTIGLLEVVGKGLTEADVPAIATFANQTAIALENVRLYQEVQQRAESLRESEERFRQMAENIQEVFWVSSPDVSQMLYLSPAFEKVWGRTRASVFENALAWVEAICPEDRDRVLAALEEHAQGKYNVEYRIARPDGAVRWIHDRGFPVRDEMGQIRRMVGIAEDITARKQAEQALQRRVTELNALNTMAAIVTQSLDVDEILNRAMDEVLRLVGVEAAAMLLLNKEASELVMVAHRGLSAEMIRVASRFKLGEGMTGRVAQTGEPMVLSRLEDYPGALKMYLEKGRVHSAAVVPLIGSSGVLGTMNLAAAGPHYFDAAGLELLGALGQQIAIGVEKARLYQETRAWAAELEERVEERTEALRASEEQYRRIVETAQEGIWTIDADSKTTFANTRMAEMLGYTVGEMLGAPLFQFMDEEGKAIAARNVERRRQGIAEQHDFKFQCKDGSAVWALLSTNPIFDKAGRYAGALAMIADITARKRTEDALHASEERFRVAAQSASDLIWDWDIPHGELQWFGAIDALLGYAPGEFPRTIEAWEGIIHPDDHDRVMATLDQHLKTRAPYIEEYRVRHKDGTFGYWTDKGEATWDEKGDAYKMIGVCTDITERKRAEEKLQAFAAELERSNRELEQFAYVASHDLQEPLRMVTSYMQLLSKRYQGKLDQDADEFIAFAVDGASRMQGLIQDLLAYSRVGTRGKELTPTDCNSVLRQTLVNLQAAIAEHRASVTNDDLPTMMVDETQLAQLFQNLIGNAIKFHGAESPRVHVSARKTCEVSETSQVWEFSVRDNGIGMDMQFAERIFGIFQRLHTRAEYPGTGIGLAICKKIVERHGGRIWVESEVGKGATFYFTIPASDKS